jgi:formylglycine-generating enzyme required for sulfatase activity
MSSDIRLYDASGGIPLLPLFLQSQHKEDCDLRIRILVGALVAVIALQVGGGSACNAATVQDCRDCPVMVVLPHGTFKMGSRPEDAARERVAEERAAVEWPQHEVTIGSAFLIGIAEVTRGQFAAFAIATGYRPAGPCTTYDQTQDAFAESRIRNWQDPGFVQTDRDPVICVDWRDANAYVNWLSVETGKRYRLPTEAEWEYAARAGTGTSRYWGDERADACAFANVADFSNLRIRKTQVQNDDFFQCTDGYAMTAPVAHLKPNAFGLFDVIGNVWEWTQDCFNPSYDGAPPNGVARLTGDCTRRVARGGSWTSPARHVTVAFRDPDLATYRSSYLGFRVARDQ